MSPSNYIASWSRFGVYRCCWRIRWNDHRWRYRRKNFNKNASATHSNMWRFDYILRNMLYWCYFDACVAISRRNSADVHHNDGDVDVQRYAHAIFHAKAMLGFSLFCFPLFSFDMLSFPVPLKPKENLHAFSQRIGPITTIIVNCVDAHIRSRAVAISTFAIHFFGDAAAPSIVGYISDRTCIST